MATIDIKSVQQILQKKVTFGHSKRNSKNSESLVITIRYGMKMFFHTYVLQIHCVCKDKLTTSHLFSVHVHKHHACQFGETRVSRGKMVGVK